MNHINCGGGLLNIITNTQPEYQIKIPTHQNNKDDIIRLQISDNFEGLEITHPDILVVETKDILPDKLKSTYKLAANNLLKLYIRNNLDHNLKYHNLAIRENVSFLKFSSVSHNQTIIICMVQLDVNYYKRNMQTNNFFDFLVDNSEIDINDYIVIIGEFNSHKADEYDQKNTEKISQENFKSINEFISSGFIDSFDLYTNQYDGKKIINNTYRTKYILLSSKFSDDEFFNLIGSYLYYQSNGIPSVVVDLYAN